MQLSRWYYIGPPGAFQIAPHVVQHDVRRFTKCWKLLQKMKKWEVLRVQVKTLEELNSVPEKDSSTCSETKDIA